MKKLIKEYGGWTIFGVLVLLIYLYSGMSVKLLNIFFFTFAIFGSTAFALSKDKSFHRGPWLALIFMMLFHIGVWYYVVFIVKLQFPWWVFMIIAIPEFFCGMVWSFHDSPRFR